MAQGSATIFDISGLDNAFKAALKHAEQLDNRLESMVESSKKLESNMKGAFSGSLGNILDRVQDKMTKVFQTKLTPDVDTSKIDSITSKMDEVVEQMKVIASIAGNKGIELFDTENIYTSNLAVVELQKKYDDIIKKIKAKEKELMSSNREAFLKTSAGKAAATKYKGGVNTKYFQDELDKFENKEGKRNELSILQEQKRKYEELLKVAKMTYDERLSYLQKILGKELSEEQKHINSIRTEYRQLSQEVFDITKQRANLEKQNKGNRLDDEISTLDIQLEERNKRRLELEEKYSDQLVDLIEKNQRKVINLKSKKLNAEDSLEQQRIKEYRSTPQGAFEFASSAQTTNEMKEAMAYIEMALGNIKTNTTTAIAEKDKLIAKYSELKTTVEEWEGKTKDQNTLVATEAAKFARLLKELNKYKKSLKELRETKAYERGDAETKDAETALLAEINVLEERKKLYAQNKESIEQATIQVAADAAREETEIIRKEEERRTEIAKQEEAKRAETARKYAGMSPDDAERAISKSGIAAIEEESRAIKDLIEQKYNLSSADKDYVAKIDDLDNKISIHKGNLEKLNAVYKEQQERKKKFAQTPQGALQSAKEAKTIIQLQQAYKNLEIASKNVNVTTASGASTFNKLSKAMVEVKDKLQKYNIELEGVGTKHTNLLNTGSQLKRALTGLFSVSAIRNYINNLINLRGEFELQHRSLQAIIGDTQMANRLWEQTTQLAIRSPYRVKELVTYTKQLAAYRIENEKLYDTTKRLADIASGVGIDMQRLILAYGQVKAANYLRGTELRQFSEAGINILGKLADRFTELEGRAVSVGDVFERVSKRMVSFADVEAVLKGMTDVGGEFYNMQEIQAETLKGLWSNLQDQIDLMLNEIGKANEDILKGSIKAVAELVKNWQALAFAIEAVIKALGAATLAYIAFNRASLQGGIMNAMKQVSAGAKIKDIIVQGNILDKVVIKLGTRFTKLGKTIKTLLSTFGKLNPAIKGIAFVIGGLSLFKNWNDYLKESNKTFDEIIDKSIQTTGELVKYNYQIEKNNKIIKENTKIKNDATKTDEERATAEIKLNEAQRENISIANKIQNTYSAVSNEFEIAKNGIIDFANAFKIANIELATSTSLADKMKSRWAGVDDSLSSSYSKFIEETKKITEKSNAYDKVSTSFLGNIGQKYGDRVKKAAYYAVEEARKYAAQGDVLNATGLFTSLQKVAGVSAEDILEVTDAIRAYAWAVNNSKGEQKDFVKDIAAGRKDIKELYKSYLTLGLSAEQAQKRLKDYINTWLTEMGVVDERARDIAQETIMLGFDFEIDFSDKDINDEIKKNYKEIAKKIIGKHKEEAQKDGVTMEFVYAASGIEETEDFVGAIDAVVKGYQETDNKIKKLKDSSEKYNQEELTQLNLRLKTLKAIAQEYGILHLLDKNSDKTASSLNKKRISLIKEMRTSYVKTNKYDTAPDLSSFEGAFNELFAGTGIKFSDIIVSTSGDVAKTLEKLRPLVERVGGESGKALMVEFEKAVGEYSTESTVEGFENYLKGVKTSMDNLLEDYSAGLELAKMGFTDKNIKDLFGVETVSLETMKAVLKKMGKTLDTMGTEGQNIFQEYSDKIADLEDKEQQRRLKEYSKYLLKGQSERLKIEKDALRQIREVNELRASGAYTDTEANDIIKGIQAERNKQIAKLDWQQFKESDIYIQMFEDLGDKSYTVLSMIKERLAKVREEMQKSGEAIDPSDMKELVRAMEQVDDAMNNRGLFKGWGQSGYLKEMKHRKEYEEQYAQAVEDSSKATEQKKQAIEKLATAKENYNNAVKTAEQHEAVVSARANLETTKISGTKEEQDAAEALYNATYDTYVTQNQQVKVQKTLLSSAEKTVEQTTQAAETANKGLEKATTNMNNLNNATKKASDNVSEMSELIQGISSIMSALGSADNLFGSEHLKKDFAAIGGMIGDVATAGTSVAKVIANPADIGSWVQIITSLISLIDRIFGLGQTKTDRAIDAQYEKIAKLEKEYQKLEKSISEAYDTQDLIRYNQELQNNLELQKQAAAEAKAAAESGKDNEKNQQAAEDAQAKYDELLEESAEKAKELFSTMTAGVFDDTLSAAEGFVDAWLEAYKEVGDGMSGLTEHFEEEMMSVVKRQAALQIVGQYANMWKNMLETSAEGGLDRQKIEAYIAKVKEDLPQLSEALEQFFKDFPLTSGNELSGIQKGIQGITADQADVLAAYWNSVRFYMASVDQKFDIPLSRISVLTDDYNTNPMLQELRAISGNTSKILDALNSVIDTNGGRKAIRLK